MLHFLSAVHTARVKALFERLGCAGTPNLKRKPECLQLLHQQTLRCLDPMTQIDPSWTFSGSDPHDRSWPKAEWLLWVCYKRKRTLKFRRPPATGTLAQCLLLILVGYCGRRGR